MTAIGPQHTQARIQTSNSYRICYLRGYWASQRRVLLSPLVLLALLYALQVWYWTWLSNVALGDRFILLETQIESFRRQKRKHTPNPRYAYAFVVGGCDPDTRSHWNFLFNILVATKILRETGSKADFVVFLQMKYNTLLTRLPISESRWLESLNITQIYIPPDSNESFYSTMMDKFRILGLTQYDRVIYMDSDVMPIANLDYIMEMSTTGKLKENFVVQGRNEPANGGFFMLKPYDSALSEMNDLLKARLQNALDMGPPYFDEKIGWGHQIEAPDRWEGYDTNGTCWNFWAAFADQGLLYHWTKYYRKSVSIAIVDPHGKTSPVHSWGANSKGGVHRETILAEPFELVSKPLLSFSSLKSRPPVSDFVHFTGRAKPWIKGLTKMDKLMLGRENSRQFWFRHLSKLSQELEIGLDIEEWGDNGISVKGHLGSFPQIHQMLPSLSKTLSIPTR